MDPQATLNTYLAVGDREAARNYNDWASAGGLCGRVQTHPATDAWMQGDRFGDVIYIARTGRIHVRMDVGGRLRYFTRDNLLPVG